MRELGGVTETISSLSHLNRATDPVTQVPIYNADQENIMWENKKFKQDLFFSVAALIC